METRTIVKLAEITDEGLFERIATAVLRLDPGYEGIAHTGINADGKTRRSPVDGLRFTGEGGSRLIVVHHTTTAADALDRKWLLDPSTMTRRPGSKSPPPPIGDALKSFEIVREERAGTPTLAATLVLATNQEPDEALIRKVVAAGRAEDVTVDVWTRSRIASRLDTDPRGQIIRRKLLGIEEELLSRELMLELSLRSIEGFHAGDNARLRVARSLDSQLGARRGPLTFIVAGSGSGKTVAGHKALLERVSAGGAAIVVTDAVIEATLSLEQAVMATLLQLQPTLAPSQNPLAIFSEEDPLLVLIEDVNRSAQPSRLVEKLAGWLPSEGGGRPTWRILCPVWPHVLLGVRVQLGDKVAAMSFQPAPMTHDEATKAVVAHAASAGVTLPSDRAGAIAAELGDDPLLIGLNRDWSAPRADRVIDRFVEDALVRAAQSAGSVAGELRTALLDLGGALLRQRRFEPSWDEVLGWGLSESTLERLRVVAQSADVLWIDGPSSDSTLRFRHDRVRDWVLAEAALALDRDGRLDDALIGEPALAEVIGAVLVRAGAPEGLVARVVSLGPLAVFHALRLAPGDGSSTTHLADAAASWLSSPESRTPANATLRWHAMAALEGAVGEHVRGLVVLFPERSPMGMIAELRNGDVRGGIDLSHAFDIHTVVAWSAGPLEAMPPSHRAAMVTELAELIDADDDAIEGRRSALIEFAGVLGDPALAPALERMWNRDERREAHLAIYLWGVARCATPETAVRLLDPVCALWAHLPSTREGDMPAPRDELAAYEIRFAFERATPRGAIGYFVERAKRPDLAWQIEFMLHGIDHPEAILLQVDRGAERLGGGNDNYVFMNQAREHWRRTNEGFGVPMSSPARAMLQELWQDEAVAVERRKAAFDIWSMGRENGDLAFLRKAAADPVLADRVLRQRLERGDTAAIPALVQRLDSEHGMRWWFYARHVWSAAMYDALDRNLRREADKPPADEHGQYEIGSTLTKVVMRLAAADAERLLLRYWNRFGPTMHFVQAALYVGTPQLLAKADLVIRESSDPRALFTHFITHFGVRDSDEIGITRKGQIEALAPYFGYIRKEDLDQLADVCNESGWFELRRQLIDPQLDVTGVKNVDRFRRKLDDTIASAHLGFIDFDIDRMMKTDVSWRELAEVLRAWLAEQTSEPALDLADRAIRHAGERGDAAILAEWKGSDTALLESRIADLDFALRRKDGRRR